MPGRSNTSSVAWVTTTNKLTCENFPGTLLLDVDHLTVLQANFNLQAVAATRQWPEVSDFVACFCTLHESENTRTCENRTLFRKHTDMRESVRFLHVCGFSGSCNVQKRATKSDTLGYCLAATLMMTVSTIILPADFATNKHSGWSRFSKKHTLNPFVDKSVLDQRHHKPHKTKGWPQFVPFYIAEHL